MGALLSKNKGDSDNYEQILSELDNDVLQKEIQLSEIRVQDRRVSLLWMFHSTLLWILYIVYYLYALHGKYQEVQFFALTVSPILLGPLCIFYIRKSLKWAYQKRLASLETSLKSLRQKQTLKVEELKKKTAYYTTKSLLERYDPTSETKKELDEQKRNEILKEKKKQKRLKQHPVPQYGQQQTRRMMGPPAATGQPMTTPQKQWYDKLVDVLIGEDGLEVKYALICTHCYAHNGLVLPQEMDDIQYSCPHCHQFNPSRKSRTLCREGVFSS